jgi:hypothetical protein
MSIPLALRAKRTLPWKSGNSSPDGIVLDSVFYGPDPAGPGGLGFQVASARLTSGKSAPTLSDLRTLHSLRKGKGTTPLVVVVTNETTAWLIGPDTQSASGPTPQEQTRRYLQSVLDEPTTQAAYNRMISLRHAADTSMVAGITNSGLFASYHLRENAKRRPDWAANQTKAELLLTLRGQQLIHALGFQSQQGAGGTQILSNQTGVTRAVAVLLTEDEHFDAKSARFQLSPAAFGLRIAMSQGINWLVVLRKDQIRLYPGKDGIGVGQKGQTETFFEIDLAALDTEYSALLPLVFSADALALDGSTQQLLDASARYATDLGTRLRDRIYKDVVPPLATAVAEQMAKQGHSLNSEGLALAYRVTLRILFRLLFQAYAEDRGLLPSGRNEHYDHNSLKIFAHEYRDTAPEDFSVEASSIWLDIVQVWDAIDKGNKLWQVPAYNGGLFSTDPQAHSEGALIEHLSLPDAVIGPALQALLVDLSEDDTLGPVDFRSLSVREFGTIYEGLLESSLSLADQDLTLDKNGAWVPAKNGDTVEAPAGAVYFHSASGERKATGSYFTPKIVVDHLIERSVTPALQTHLDRVAKMLADGDEVAAERAFFDFRVVDLAMGSGHFLVAAVDKIEALMRNFLTEHTLPSVQSELLRLAKVAADTLGDDETAKAEVENIALLRRQVARRCIYGLDINPMAVELARLAIWIHTFVPGLPMSNLDHGLVCANSLTGIGTIEEALDALQPERIPGQGSLFDSLIMESLASAKALLQDVANADEANKAEAKQAAQLIIQAKAAAEPTRLIFDAAIATRIGRLPVGTILSQDDINRVGATGLLNEVNNQLHPAHLPYLFPEAFLRDNPGFDVTVGNPPWEKAKVEEHQWWGLRIPKLRSMPQKQKNAALREFQDSRPDLMVEYLAEVAAADGLRSVLIKGPYPGIGKGGDPDLYQAFAWRNWQLARSIGGRVALVLPRGALSGASLAEWRKTVLSEGAFSDVCFLSNANNWVFENVDGRYTVGLTVLERGTPSLVCFAGPFFSAKEFNSGAGQLAQIDGDEFASWSSNSAFPLINDKKSADIFRQLKKSPRFDEIRPGWAFRPIAELHASSDKTHFNVDLSKSAGRIPVVKGASFNLWEPDFGPPYAYADPDELRKHLSAKLKRAMTNKNSAYFGMTFTQGSLPLDRPRIAFRDIARSTDSRTMLACLLPPGTVAQHTAPLLVNRDGDERSEAFLVGVLSSIPFDWTARRWVELHMTFEILSALPLPEFDLSNQLCQRVVEVAGRLAAVDERYIDWANAVGSPVGSVTSHSEKDDLIAELDALVSLLYGLTDDQVEHIFATFHRGWDFASRLESVLRHYRQWKARA